MYRRLVWIFLAALVSMFALSTPAVEAAGVVGNGTPASCTEAALDAKLATGGTVRFNCGPAMHTITVTSQKTISKKTTVDGGGRITLSGGGTTRIFYNTNTHKLLTLRNLTLRDGLADGDGGAVWNDWRGNLTIDRVIFVNNVSRQPVRAIPENNDYGGGAIFHKAGTLTITRSEFRGNRVLNGSGGAVHTVIANVSITNTLFDSNQAEGGYGGAIYVDATGRPSNNGFIRLTGDRFINNSAQGQGGAVFTFIYPTDRGADVLVDRSEFTNNRVTADARGDAFGGALRHGNGPLVLRKTTFTGNVAGRQGGALWTGEVGAVTISQVQFNNNTVQSTTDGYGGGYMVAGSGVIRITNGTFNSNHAGFQGGAIFGSAANKITLARSTFINNTAVNPWGISQSCMTTYRNGGSNRQRLASTSDTHCSARIKVIP